MTTDYITKTCVCPEVCTSRLFSSFLIVQKVSGSWVSGREVAQPARSAGGGEQEGVLSWTC